MFVFVKEESSTTTKKPVRWNVLQDDLMASVKDDDDDDDDDEDKAIDRLTTLLVTAMESICLSTLLVPRPESCRSVDERLSSFDDADVGERSSTINGSLKYPSGAGTLS